MGVVMMEPLAAQGLVLDEIDDGAEQADGAADVIRQRGDARVHAFSRVSLALPV